MPQSDSALPATATCHSAMVRPILHQQFLRVVAHHEAPYPQLPPAVHCTHPALGSLVLGRHLGGLRTFHLQQQVQAVAQPHHKIWFIGPRLTIKLIRHGQLQPVVTHIALN